MLIVIPGNPIPKARPRFSVRGKHAIAYNPQAKLLEEKRIELRNLSFEQDINDFKPLFSDPLRVTFEFHMPINDKGSNSEKNAKLHGLIEPDTKPDIDNLIKFWDIANGILWRDDAQIVEMHAYQKYSETPCTIITVNSIKNTMNEEAQKMMRIFSPSALDKLESDVSCLRAELEGVRLCNLENRNSNFESAAGCLKAFASTYCESLKKMTKATK